MTADPLDFLAARTSAPSKQLESPGPDETTLKRLLEIAIRVPDHGKLVPWRLLILRGEAKAELGRRLAELAIAKQPDMPEKKKDKERRRYSFAPLVIAVIARIDAESRIPEREQLLSAGCVAYNLLLGAQALGFGAQWLTSWAAYDRDAAAILDLADNECIAGFIHIGTPKRDVPERVRPPLESVVSTWTA
jgi:nitroreductase